MRGMEATAADARAIQPCAAALHARRVTESESYQIVKREIEMLIQPDLAFGASDSLESCCDELSFAIGASLPLASHSSWKSHLYSKRLLGVVDRGIMPPRCPASTVRAASDDSAWMSRDSLTSRLSTFLPRRAHSCTDKISESERVSYLVSQRSQSSEHELPDRTRLMNPPLMRCMTLRELLSPSRTRSSDLVRELSPCYEADECEDDSSEGK
ncbi:hypothetical protein FVE85_8866 [Porphyridium purpureum]|uniref:Uncharacterized protein n=1 Tax=Porphyridium purpureum TaxID=35688 RepID=A0A5J4YPH3_PORPP|nr:hypothetical protein FVE85_8866 [Porphyridium purpureum]|eukprot:POR5087..scf296_7